VYLFNRKGGKIQAQIGFRICPVEERNSLQAFSRGNKLKIFMHQETEQKKNLHARGKAKGREQRGKSFGTQSESLYQDARGDGRVMEHLREGVSLKKGI